MTIDGKPYLSTADAPGWPSKNLQPMSQIRWSLSCSVIPTLYHIRTTWAPKVGKTKAERLQRDQANMILHFFLGPGRGPRKKRPEPKAAGHAGDSKNMDHGCSMISSGIPSFFGFWREHGHVPTFKLLLYLD